MTYASRFMRVTISGILGPAATPKEIWSNSISFAVNAPQPTTRFQMGQYADAFRVPIETFYTGMCTSQVGVTNVRASMLGDDGKTLRDVDGAYLHADSASTVRGVVTGVAHAFQVALAISLGSAAEGANARGRFYVPCPGYGVSASGGLSATQQTEIAGKASTLLGDMNAVAGSGSDVYAIIASQGSPLRAVPPKHYPVTHVRVGAAFDTVTRRRNDLAEAYVENPVGGGGTF